MPSAPAEKRHVGYVLEARRSEVLEARRSGRLTFIRVVEVVAARTRVSAIGEGAQRTAQFAELFELQFADPIGEK